MKIIGTETFFHRHLPPGARQTGIVYTVRGAGAALRDLFVPFKGLPTNLDFSSMRFMQPSASNEERWALFDRVGLTDENPGPSMVTAIQDFAEKSWRMMERGGKNINERIPQVFGMKAYIKADGVRGQFFTLYAPLGPMRLAFAILSDPAKMLWHPKDLRLIQQKHPPGLWDLPLSQMPLSNESVAEELIPLPLYDEEGGFERSPKKRAKSQLLAQLEIEDHTL